MKIGKNESGYFYRENADDERNFLHREQVERFIGRSIPPGYQVHHIDGDRTNNALGNLALVRPADHREIHATADANVIRELEEDGQRLIQKLRDEVLAENRSARRALTAKKPIIRRRSP